jgi:hypothetical protein
MHIPSKGSGIAIPSASDIRLAGNVYNHPSNPDGTGITTSLIVQFNGLEAITASRPYTLDGMSKAYARWLSEQNFSIDDPNHPLYEISCEAKRINADAPITATADAPIEAPTDA